MDAEGAGIYGSQARDDFDRDDVEQPPGQRLCARCCWRVSHGLREGADGSRSQAAALQYFNYMGMLATEGTYDKMEALLQKGLHPVDILLLLAASEGDTPKIEELLRLWPAPPRLQQSTPSTSIAAIVAHVLALLSPAGAKSDVPDAEGRTALDRASSEDVRQLICDGARPATV
eukprot:SM002618S09927  [mRNA]  locus=s2618:1035:1644:- [translate_table: standard]